MDRGAQRATVHGVTESWTRLKGLSTHGPCLGCLQIYFVQGPQVPFPATLGGLPSNPYLRLGLCWAQAQVRERGALGHPPEGLEQARAALWSSGSSLQLWPEMEDRSVTSPYWPSTPDPPCMHTKPQCKVSVVEKSDLVDTIVARLRQDTGKTVVLTLGAGDIDRLVEPLAEAVKQML